MQVAVAAQTLGGLSAFVAFGLNRSQSSEGAASGRARDLPPHCQSADVIDVEATPVSTQPETLADRRSETASAALAAAPVVLGYAPARRLGAPPSLVYGPPRAGLLIDVHA